MALVLKDRVKETTTTTGTGTYTLAGAVTGFEAFSEIGDGNTTYYACTDGTDFEVGVGTYTASGTTLARTTILQSSNSDAAVNWTAGTRNIFITQPAEKAVFLNADGNLDLDGVELILDADGDTSITADTDDQIHFRSAGGDELILTTSQLRPFLDLGLSLGSISRRYSNIYGLSANIGSGGITVSGTVDGRDVATDGTKLDGIEASADVTDATNVAAAGALMDSEVTNLAQVKAFDASDYATAAQGATADAALLKAGGQMTGNITFSGSQTVDGRDVSADGAKLDGIEASADVTDATNVNAAGAAIFSTTPTANITDGTSGQVLTTNGSGTLSFSSGTAAPQEINAITTTYTTVLSDAGKILTLNDASGFTVSFPNNINVAYPIGTRIDFIQIGAGQISFQGLTGVTVNATPTLKMRAQHSAASCIKIATDTWQLVGDLAES